MTTTTISTLTIQDIDAAVAAADRFFTRAFGGPDGDEVGTLNMAYLCETTAEDKLNGLRASVTQTPAELLRLAAAWAEFAVTNMVARGGCSALESTREYVAYVTERAARLSTVRYAYEIV